MHLDMVQNRPTTNRQTTRVTGLSLCCSLHLDVYIKADSTVTVMDGRDVCERGAYLASQTQDETVCGDKIQWAETKTNRLGNDHDKHSLAMSCDGSSIV